MQTRRSVVIGRPLQMTAHKYSPNLSFCGRDRVLTIISDACLHSRSGEMDDKLSLRLESLNILYIGASDEAGFLYITQSN
jgi:hypothetical protein